MAIVPKLSLNKHPKDCINGSLINAQNVKLSEDGTCLQSEESIFQHGTIIDFISDNYINYHIISCIPCNKELIILLFAGIYNEADMEQGVPMILLRYNEEKDIIYEVTHNLLYHGGNIHGTFTYNVSNELILAIAERTVLATGEDSPYVKVPLKTLNVGKFNPDAQDGVDYVLDDELVSACPEVKIPSITNLNYVNGFAYKGWYEIFLRYKINKTDYTNWFSIGHKVLIDTLEKRNIIKVIGYGLKTEDSTNGITFDRTETVPTGGNVAQFATGCIDNFNDEKESCNETISFEINNFDSERYNKYQLGFICNRRDKSFAYRTNDIDQNNRTYTFNIKDCIEYNVQDLIITYYNYYNVKTLCNYKNRLYIGNYGEIVPPISTINNLVSKINLSYSAKQYTLNDEKYVLYKDKNADIELDSIDAATLSIVEDENYNIFTPTLYYNVSDKILVTKLSYCEFADSNGVRYKPEVSYIHGQAAAQTICLDFKINNISYCKAWYTVDNATGNILIDAKSDKFEASTINIPSVYDNEKFTKYFNTSKSFVDRKVNSTLIPGECYNFFVHFVNKYGEATQGYQIPCKLSSAHYMDGQGRPVDIVDKLRIDISVGPTESTPIEYSIFYDIDTNVFEDDDITVGTVLRWLDNRKSWQPVTDAITLNAVKGALRQIANNYPIDFNLKWFQIASALRNEENEFIPFKTDNGEIIHKLPFTTDSIIGNVNHSLYYTKYDLNIHTDFTQDELKEAGFVGYYISYEKFESIAKYTGLLNKYDYNDDTQNNTELTNYNENNSNKLSFYTSNFDIDEHVNLDFNMMLVTGVNFVNEITKDKIRVDVIDKNFYANLNQIDNFNIEYAKYYPVTNPKLYFAGDKSNQRMSISTALIIDDNGALSEDYTQAKATLLNVTTKLYMNKVKTLIRLSDVIYTTDDITISSGLNGFITYNDFLIYNGNKVILYSGTNSILSGLYKPYNWFNENQSDKFLIYCQLAHYSTEFNETKEFNNNPKILSYFAEPISSNANQVIPQYLGCFVEPKDSIDLFVNKYANPDSLLNKTYSNYIEDAANVSEFTHTVRRSNVIQDESLVNAWRQFPVEGYKIISENKGDITNVVGIGTVLLVHTQHSLFMFDADNTLQTQDKAVSLTMLDIFDVSYKEVVTSELGRCGLQDTDSWILDRFGYIFYDNDENRFYRFDNKTVEFIDVDIVNYLNKYRPTNIRFANDNRSNRILISYKINNQLYTISYSYVTNTFISTHTYYFNKAYNTKNVLYLLYNNDIHIYLYEKTNDTEYNFFQNGIPYGLNKSKVDIIINPEYVNVKTLEYLVYKLYKIDRTDTEYILNDIEKHKEPYSGEILRVFNNLVDTGELNIKIDVESSKNVYRNWTKPHWDLTNWNMNYLRNILTQSLTSHKSRLYGNYFIVSITFGGTADKCELEFIEGVTIHNR